MQNRVPGTELQQKTKKAWQPRSGHGRTSREITQSCQAAANLASLDDFESFLIPIDYFCRRKRVTICSRSTSPRPAKVSWEGVTWRRV